MQISDTLVQLVRACLDTKTGYYALEDQLLEDGWPGLAYWVALVAPMHGVCPDSLRKLDYARMRADELTCIEIKAMHVLRKDIHVSRSNHARRFD